MDLIYTNAGRIDQGVVPAYNFDLSYGAEENDFELTIGKKETPLEYGAYVYIEGTEYGGIVGAMKTTSNADSVTFMGRTWHGIMNSKIIEPDVGANYLVVSGDANEVLSVMVARLGLSELFVVDEKDSGIHISGYQFHRYCKGYDGLCDMLADYGAKLRIVWNDRVVRLSAEPIADYTESPVDDDETVLSVEQHNSKVNHLVCLGSGNLAEREVIHLYLDQFGKIGDTQYYTGLSEIADTYDNSNAEDLRSEGIKRFKELLDIDSAEISMNENNNIAFDIGDKVGSTDITTGVTVSATVTQKIVKINNGFINIEYKTGR
jgi:hypothetical protein